MILEKLDQLFLSNVELAIRRVLEYRQVAFSKPAPHLPLVALDPDIVEDLAGPLLIEEFDFTLAGYNALPSRWR